MNQNKIIIIALVILIFIGLGWLAYFLLGAKNPNSNVNLSQNYYLVTLTTVDQKILGTAQIGDKQVELNTANLKQYASIGFNSTYETMWISCAQGYTLKNPASETNNNVALEEGIGASMSLNKDAKNTVSFVCSK
jgi:hypothetical protein